MRVARKRKYGVIKFSLWLLFIGIFGITITYASIFTNLASLFKSEKTENNRFSREILASNDLLKPNIVNQESADLVDKSINDNGMLTVSAGPMRVSTEKEVTNDGTISLYEVKPGDTLSTIANLFGVSVNTIIWANDLEDKTIHMGESLLIFPMNGLEYTVKSGGTIYDIAKKYKADAGEIASYNGLSLEVQLKKGDKLFIPDAEIEIAEEKPKKKSIVKKIVSIFKKETNDGYFILPVVGCIKTQGLHGPYHSAVDIGCPVGTRVRASASGVIIRADDTGYNGGYGKVIIISHPGNIQTIYAHLAEIDVSVGESVSQGEFIGKTGNTGHSTGPHVHFETRGIANPF